MKIFKCLIIFLVLIVCSVSLSAQSIVVNPTHAFWDANTETDLAGYKIYISTTQGGPYTAVFDIPLDTLSDPTKPEYIFDHTNRSVGNYYVVVTAYDEGNLESGYSNEVPFKTNTDAPVNPTGLRCGKL